MASILSSSFAGFDIQEFMRNLEMGTVIISVAGDEDDNLSDTEDFVDDHDQPDDSEYARQCTVLKGYINALPYECESIDDMHAKLGEIVGKIIICAEAKYWLQLANWDSMLRCWLLLKYPIPTTTLAKLIRLYYELVLVPGIEPRISRSWSELLLILLSNKYGARRRLNPNDLQLPWKPLWRVLQKELWPKKRHQSSSNMVNALLFVADKCKAYYPIDEIPEMLNTFLPLFTKESYLTMIPVLVSFLPPKQIHLYIPVLFKLWEAFNSALLDDRLLELAGLLSVEHVEGDAGEPGGAKWKDIGIWTEAEWTYLMGKGLGSMNVPVGATKGASTTAGHADSSVDSDTRRIKKYSNRFRALARIIVCSLAVDGPVRSDGRSGSSTPNTASGTEQQSGYIAGSKALESLDKLITSTESFFHPSNAGTWTIALTGFLSYLTFEFSVRWKKEQLRSCKVPMAQRLTPSIRHAFVRILRTPALLSMFSKDPINTALTQAALKTMAILEPSLIMPEILERAYGGLETINETHRTTAVLGALSGVALPLVRESLWLGGQKHVVPLLELCIPGIDLNDPIKTVNTCIFILAVVQHIKIGDLSMHQSGVPFSDDAPTGDVMMDADAGDVYLPSGVEGTAPVLNRDAERALARESTAGFADWVTSLFRRVLALYENLPEEGGRKNSTGGKQEESVLKSVKNMLGVVCLHLSDQMFDLVLKLVYEYAITNAKSNSVKAFGQLIACMARVRPEQTIERFSPFCVEQVREELKYGASSHRTTSSSHEAVPSDTTLHWNMFILRGCLGSEGAAPTLMKHRAKILDLLKLLVDKTKNERGYSGTGRLITRILHVLSDVYPINYRFVNDNEWKDPAFEKDHNLAWGKLHRVQDTKIEWHVPSREEIDFILQILEEIALPSMEKVEVLLKETGRWDNIARNDFCRYLNTAKAVWSGLPTLYKEMDKEMPNLCLRRDIEAERLLVTPLDINCSFTLTDSRDTRYQKALAHHTRFGNVVHACAVALRQNEGGEDHIDAVILTAKAVEAYLVDYALTRNGYESLQKSYDHARGLSRTWLKAAEHSRYVFLKRAQEYHGSRVYMDALYRRRSSLDDQILFDLAELSVSQYTRVRRQAQSTLHTACGYYARSTRLILPTIFQALSKGNDPDRMKGALYILQNKGMIAYALSDMVFHGQFLMSLLESQHEEKPSVQKMVSTVAQDCLTYLAEESVHTDSYVHAIPRLQGAAKQLQVEFPFPIVDPELLAEVSQKSAIRVVARNAAYRRTISSVSAIVRNPNTHWRYTQMAVQFLNGLIRRDIPVQKDISELLAELVLSPQPSVRTYAQRALVKVMFFIKVRTYAKTFDEMWLNEWKNPRTREIVVGDLNQLMRNLLDVQGGASQLYVDKLTTGFLTWTPTLKAYTSPADNQLIIWDPESQQSLQGSLDVLRKQDFFDKLALLWGQESNRQGSKAEIRSENVGFIKTIAKMFYEDVLNNALSVVDAFVFDADRFKQRAAAEILIGLLRGSKHWPKPLSDQLWSWAIERLPRIFHQIKPDTLTMWELTFGHILEDRDPRRMQPLVEWALTLPQELGSESAFSVVKALSILGIIIYHLDFRFNPLADAYANLLMDHTNTDYDEIREHIARNLETIRSIKWRPCYPSTAALLDACKATRDPLRIFDMPYMDRLASIGQQLTVWKTQRLPPPRVSQSEYDKVGLSIMHWIWAAAHGPNACLILPYAIRMMPEILQMSELNDSAELQKYSSAVLYVLSAVSPPREYIGAILNNFVNAIKSSTSWRIRLHALPALVVFFYRNLLNIESADATRVMDVLLDCLSDGNVEVREMASKALSGVVRCSQRQSIVPLKNRFVTLVHQTRLPSRSQPGYADSLRALHSAFLGLCALIESFPYSVEPWMPSLTEVLALHASDPPPISTTIRKCASEFKKTHQDTWHKDQEAFNEDQIQCLSTMLVGTSYYA